jgi:hypothetical protein
MSNRRQREPKQQAIQHQLPLDLRILVRFRVIQCFLAQFQFPIDQAPEPQGLWSRRTLSLHPRPRESPAGAREACRAGAELPGRARATRPRTDSCSPPRPLSLRLPRARIRRPPSPPPPALRPGTTGPPEAEPPVPVTPVPVTPVPDLPGPDLPGPDLPGPDLPGPGAPTNGRIDQAPEPQECPRTSPTDRLGGNARPL